jgi:hypothetical protein
MALSKNEKPPPTIAHGNNEPPTSTMALGNGNVGSRTTVDEQQ